MVELSTLFSKVFEDPALHRTILTVLVQLLRDPEVIKAAVDLSVALAAKPEVNEVNEKLPIYILWTNFGSFHRLGYVRVTAKVCNERSRRSTSIK
jgi:hypothetical protein